MANYKGHIIGGAVVNTLFVGVLYASQGVDTVNTSFLMSNWQFLAFLYVVAILFSLWPDVDTNSKGQNIFYSGAFLIDIVLIISGRIEAAAYLGLLGMTPILSKHRGWTHSKLAMILVPLPLVIVPYLYRPESLMTMSLIYGSAVVGYFSHLLFDGLIIKRFRVRGNRYG